MTEPAPPLSVAETRAARARDRLSSTLLELRSRLEPRALVETAKREATDKGAAAARAGVDAAQRNPGATAGAVAAIGLFLARHRIARLFRRRPRKVPAAPRSGSDRPPAQPYTP